MNTHTTNVSSIALKSCSKCVFLVILMLSRYIDLSVQGKALNISPLTEKLLHYKACLHFYDTLDRSYTKASIESIESIL